MTVFLRGNQTPPPKPPSTPGTGQPNPLGKPH